MGIESKKLFRTIAIAALSAAPFGCSPAHTETAMIRTEKGTEVISQGKRQVLVKAHSPERLEAVKEVIAYRCGTNEEISSDRASYLLVQVSIDSINCVDRVKARVFQRGLSF
jgi:hypothetical protein